MAETQNEDYLKSTEYIYDLAMAGDFVLAKDTIKKHKHIFKDVEFEFYNNDTNIEDTVYCLNKLFY